MVALSPSSLMISPIRLSAPTRMSSYIAAPDMLSAMTTGPDTLRTYLRRGRDMLSSKQQGMHMALRAGIQGVKAESCGKSFLKTLCTGRTCTAHRTRLSSPTSSDPLPSCRGYHDRRKDLLLVRPVRLCSRSSDQVAYVTDRAPVSYWCIAHTL